MRIIDENDIKNPRVLLTDLAVFDMYRTNLILERMLPDIDYVITHYDMGDVYHTQHLEIIIDYTFAEEDTFVFLKTGMTLKQHIELCVKESYHTDEPVDITYNTVL